MYLKCDWKGHSRKCLWWGRKWILAHTAIFCPRINYRQRIPETTGEKLFEAVFWVKLSSLVVVMGVVSWQWNWQKVNVLSNTDLSTFCSLALWAVIIFMVDEHSWLWNEESILALVHRESVLTSAWTGNWLEGFVVEPRRLHSMSPSRGMHEQYFPLGFGC